MLQATAANLCDDVAFLWSLLTAPHDLYPFLCGASLLNILAVPQKNTYDLCTVNFSCTITRSTHYQTHASCNRQTFHSKKSCLGPDLPLHTVDVYEALALPDLRLCSKAFYRGLDICILPYDGPQSIYSIIFWHRQNPAFQPQAYSQRPPHSLTLNADNPS